VSADPGARSEKEIDRMTLTFLRMVRKPSVIWLTIVMAVLASPACRADPVKIEIDIKPFIGTTTDPVTGKQTQFISQWEAGGFTTPPFEFSEIRLITSLDFSNPLGSDDFGAYREFIVEGLNGAGELYDFVDNHVGNEISTGLTKGVTFPGTSQVVDEIGFDMAYHNANLQDFLWSSGFYYFPSGFSGQGTAMLPDQSSYPTTIAYGLGQNFIIYNVSSVTSTILTPVTAAPEPAMAGLLATGILLIAAIRWARSYRKSESI
jgi:hypothetical protein